MKQKTSEAKKTLETWKESYFDVRAKIEASGRDARWEFDRKRLFERTDHMASICEDLKEVATVMEEFYNIFGPELKAVTGDPKRIEDVLKRVDGLVKPIENVSSRCSVVSLCPAVTLYFYLEIGNKSAFHRAVTPLHTRLPLYAIILHIRCNSLIFEAFPFARLDLTPLVLGMLQVGAMLWTGSTEK